MGQDERRTRISSNGEDERQHSDHLRALSSIAPADGCVATAGRIVAADPASQERCRREGERAPRSERERPHAGIARHQGQHVPPSRRTDDQRIMRNRSTRDSICADVCTAGVADWPPVQQHGHRGTARGSRLHNQVHFAGSEREHTSCSLFAQRSEARPNFF